MRGHAAKEPVFTGGSWKENVTGSRIRGELVIVRGADCLTVLSYVVEVDGCERSSRVEQLLMGERGKEDRSGHQKEADAHKLQRETSRPRNSGGNSE